MNIEDRITVGISAGNTEIVTIREPDDRGGRCIMVYLDTWLQFVEAVKAGVFDNLDDPTALPEPYVIQAVHVQRCRHCDEVVVLFNGAWLDTDHGIANECYANMLDDHSAVGPHEPVLEGPAWPPPATCRNCERELVKIDKRWLDTKDYLSYCSGTRTPSPHRPA